MDTQSASPSGIYPRARRFETATWNWVNLAIDVGFYDRKTFQRYYNRLVRASSYPGSFAPPTTFSPCGREKSLVTRLRRDLGEWFISSRLFFENTYLGILIGTLEQTKNFTLTKPRGSVGAPTHEEARLSSSNSSLANVFNGMGQNYNKWRSSLIYVQSTLRWTTFNACKSAHQRAIGMRLPKHMCFSYYFYCLAKLSIGLPWVPEVSRSRRAGPKSRAAENWGPSGASSSAPRCPQFGPSSPRARNLWNPGKYRSCETSILRGFLYRWESLLPFIIILCIRLACKDLYILLLWELVTFNSARATPANTDRWPWARMPDEPSVRVYCSAV